MKPSSRFVAQCPLCQTSYPEAGIQLLRETGITRLFHCTCASCGRAMLAVILESSGWVSSVGLMTDLEAADALRFQSAAAITSDECVNMHRLLERQSGEACQALLTRIRSSAI